ncbi:TPA: type II toxin-antitoxin system Phd/YefM family antitoxin [Streptococcus suis]|uniref:toxin-antitoxin system antitoxin component n=1 Tax=Streptococcus TaxID=1301 RepID=UPI00042A0176|nr:MULTISPECIES: toxin-antitoxin system antitoxin component [Streptococcus]MBO4108657.1 type II toxin-antitoxin system Phd/YefM family antitoxin [Streptococcus suis]MBY0720555.1 type II toxin-antitoxin system Phd/YefM family antitoxin [Streptococcus sp. 2018110]MCO8236084.1 type II toxin-antitoxin system Phd/YefM family antitoxin [Streptococcus suis]MDG3136924.1 type II toxin-antitoxin system Phd/YefM family antitoxin [Streptococcus suis]NQI85486.1 type II toxin-antitoxin system Phd/YefM famil
MNLTTFRKDIYNLSQSVIDNHEELEILVGDDGDGVVVVSMADYRALKELAYLENTGTLSTVFERMENESEDDFSIEDAL